MNKDLDLIYGYQKEATILGHLGAFLCWDQMTYMPVKGVKARSEQMVLISHLLHKKTISDDLFNALKRLRKKKLSKKDALIVKKLYKDILKARKLPEEFVKELSRTTSLAYQAWDEARAKKNFKIFQPYLEKIVELKQKECKYINEKGHPYNSLLDSFEEGMTVEKLKPIFSNLKKDLMELINKIKKTEVYKKQKKVLLKNNLPVDKQRKLCEDVISRMGLRKEFSRLDVSTHPFTERIGVEDVRITTNFRENPLFSFESTIHEAGHALYELNLPKKDAYNILGQAPSLGIHESQSRLWENMIGKGKSFWKFYYPKFKKEFGLKGSFDQLYREVNMVKPSFIRVEADEVTYCLHVILRFEIEMGLIDGSIKVKDLPRVWNRKMKEFLGIVPKDDKEGVLQDMHWSMGAIGYFSTYAIGSMYYAQLYKQLLKENKNIEKKISKGEYSDVVKWLKKKVHSLGSYYLADDIIKKVCKQGLNPDVYVSYLNEKYSEIYRFK